jgi:hypothetical protein
MTALTLRPSLFQDLFRWRSAAPSIDETSEHDAALARRTALSEMMSRNPDAFGSDLDVQMLMSQVAGGY